MTMMKNLIQPAIPSHPAHLILIKDNLPRNSWIICLTGQSNCMYLPEIKGKLLHIRECEWENVAWGSNYHKNPKGNKRTIWWGWRESWPASILQIITWTSRKVSFLDCNSAELYTACKRRSLYMRVHYVRKQSYPENKWLILKRKLLIFCTTAV